jgi:DMSO/TMAO reductase YedYZ molybdopterin-dependent catalytic subunit
MKKRPFQIALLVITFGLIWFSSLGRVLGTAFSNAHKEILAANSEWRLLVDGGVQRPLNLTFDELVAMPRSTVFSTLYCDGVFVESGNWTGVRLELVLEKAEFDPNATTVRFIAQDGYEVSLSIADAMREDVIIGYEKDGATLPETTRLVIPSANGSQWISNITQIVALTSTPEFSNIFALAISLVAVAFIIALLRRKRSCGARLSKLSKECLND